AADIMKLAMIAVDKAMTESRLKSKMLLQVHDELVFAVADGELEKLRVLTVAAMENVAKLTIPLDVQIGVGANWELAGH
ncbi:DNA polymerase, partial [Aquiluna sp.]|nr:DNA polymerase [Aquiluna sp.]